MLRYVFTFIIFCFILLFYPFQNLHCTNCGDVCFKPFSAYSKSQVSKHAPIKLYLNTSSYFYNPEENVHCNLMLMNAGDLNLISYEVTCVLMLYDSKMNKISEEKNQSTVGAINKVYPGTYFKTGGEYTLYAECLIDSQKYSVTRKFIVQSVIYDQVLLSVAPDKEQYVPGDSLTMVFTGRKPNGDRMSYTPVKVEEIFKGEKVREFDISTDFDGKAKLSTAISSAFDVNDLYYVFRVSSGEIYSVQTQRIYLNVRNIKVSFFFENGYYNADKTKHIVVVSANDKGNLTAAGCIVRNRITGDSIVVKTNSYGIGKFDLKPGDSLSHFLIYPVSQKSEAFGIKALSYSNAELAVINKTTKGIRYLFRPGIKGTVNLKIHQRGNIILDTTLKSGQHEYLIDVSTGHLPPGILQCIAFDSGNQIIAQKLNFVNRHKKLNITLAGPASNLEPGTSSKLLFKVTDETGQPVTGIFNLSVTDEKNFLMIKNQQSTISEHLLFESDLVYPVADIGMLWKCPEGSNDSMIDLFLNTCYLKDFYLPGLLSRKKNEKITCFYEFKLRRNQGGNNIFSRKEIRKVIFRSERGLYTTFVSDSGVVLVPMDTIAFPARCIVVSGKGREKFFVDETYVRIVIKKEQIALVHSGIKVTELMALNTNTAVIQEITPPVEPDRTRVTTFCSFSSSSLCKTGQRSFSGLAAFCGGITSTSTGLSGRGSRTDGTAYFIDGVRLLRPSDVIDNSGFAMSSPVTMVSSSSAGLYLMSSSRSAYYTPVHVNRYSFRKYRPNGVSIYSSRQSRYEYTPEYNKPITAYYYNTCVQSDSKGLMVLEVKTPSKPMVWHINIEGVAGTGRCGETDTTLNIQNTVYMTLRAPQMLTQNDSAFIFCTVYNTSDVKRNAVVSIDNLLKHNISLPPHGEALLQIPCYGLTFMDYTVKLTEYSGRLLQLENVDFPVIEPFFKTEQILALNNRRKFNIEIPDSAVANNCLLKLNRLSQPIDLEAYLKTMIREPYGCFEQVSSTNYPNILAYQYLIKNVEYRNEENPLFSLKAILESGYNRLAAYETAKGGFSWFGDGVGNEALTAMGLLQFYYLRQCKINVSKALEERTIKWLESKKNAEGVYVQSRGKYGFENTSGDVAHAYITYTLNMIGQMNTEQSVKAIETGLTLNDNFYNQALLFAIYLNNNDMENAEQLFMTISERAHALINHTNSTEIPLRTVIHSSRRGAVNEALAIVSTAISRNHYSAGKSLMDEINTYFLNQNFNSWGNMQSKALVIESVCNASISKKSKYQQYGVKIKVNGASLRISNFVWDSKAIDLSPYLTIGNNTIELEPDSINELQGTLIYAFETTLPYGQKNNDRLKIEANFNETIQRVGNVAGFSIKITNTTKKILPQTIAIIELPAGVTVKPEELILLKKKGIIDFYEITNTTLVLYFEEIDARQHIEVLLPVLCQVKGSFYMRPSCIYNYYQPENKTYFLSKPLRIE